MIPRTLQHELLVQLQEYPIVTFLGPRQSGKTTLVRAALPDYAFVSLEDPENRLIANEAPRTFVRTYPGNTIFDEIQGIPLLLRYLQGIVDAENRISRFVLTGSHQLELRTAITQSLAGCTGILHLLPLSIAELADAGIHYESFEEYIFHGFLPRIYGQQQRPRTAYTNYYQTHVERDLRQLIRLKDASLFEKFIKLIADRVGQISSDPLLGQIFENLVVIEAPKMRYNRGMSANLYFFRDSHGNKINLLHKSGRHMLGMEIKAAATWHSGFKKTLNRFFDKIQPPQEKYVVYNGRPLSFEDGVEAMPYDTSAEVFSDSGSNT